MTFTKKEIVVQRILMGIRPAFLAGWIKGILRIPRKTIQIEGALMWVDPISQFARKLAETNGYEPEMKDTLHRFLGPGKRFADIGANEGYFSVLAAKIVGPFGGVIAVEPQTRLQEVIKKNLMLNNLNNVKTIQSAVSDYKGEAQIHLTPNTSTGSSGLAKSTRYRLQQETIPVNTVESILNVGGFSVVDLLKMDIESFEYEAILGARKILKTHCIKALAIELHPKLIRARGKEPNKIEDILIRSGYKKDNDAKTNVWFC